MSADSTIFKDARNIGRLLVIGGAEDPDEDDMTILPHFVEMAGGKSAHIVVCGAPSENPDKKERTYRELFEKIGVASAYEARVHERHDAEDEALLEAMKKATGVFITGGDQMRLTSLIAGTPFGDIVRDRLWTDKLVVAGTSAGAAAMGSTMLTGGSSEGTVRRSDISVAPGLGYWRDTVVDTHFAQRGRISRLLAIFGQNPQVLGVGIDENTAIEVTPGQEFCVIGEGACFVIDGMVTHSNAPEVSDDEVMALTDSLLHVLPSGYGFDLRELRPIKPDGEKIAKRAQ